MKIKPLSYFEDNNLPTSEYYKQFNNITPEVGKVYRQYNSIFWSDFKIIFVGEGVALGVEVANGNNNFSVGKKALFNVGGVVSGWKHNDWRSCYRLVHEVK